MRIRIGSNVSIWIIFIVLLSMHLLYLMKLPIDSVMYSYITWAMSFAAYLYFYKGIKKIKKTDGTFLTKIFFYIFCVQIILSIYSIRTYGETILDMLICAGEYFILLLTYVIMLSFYKDGEEFLLNRVYIIELIYILIVLICSFFYNKWGVSLFAFTLSKDGLKYGRIRLGLGPLGALFFIYSFKKILRKEKILFSIFSLLIGLLGLFYSEMTRANQIAIIATLFCMWIFNREGGIRNTIKYFVFIIGAVFFFNSELFTRIINSFSSNEVINSQASSTVARINAIEYFSKYTRDNPLMGMGWVRPYTPRLTRIWAGPNEAAFFDDIGFLGQFFRLGILGASYYVIILIRMIYIIWRLDKNDKNKLVLIGILFYLICTMPSLNCFDGQRILAMPFYLAIYEYSYMTHKNMKSLVKTSRN